MTFGYTQLSTHVELPRPSHALVFHAHADGAIEITQHTIRARRGSPSLGPASLFDDAALAELVAILSARERPAIELIPDGVILQGRDQLAWVVPGAKRRMWFLAGKRKRQLMVPWPTLVFHVHHGQLRVVALDGPGRPSTSTAVYHAPLMNIYADGRVCVGNATLPTDCAYSDIPTWENVIFGTLFTHVNHDRTLRLAGRKAVDTAKHFAFWRDLAESGMEAFPTGSLTTMGMTLGRFLDLESPHA